MTIIYDVPENEVKLDEIYVVLSADDKGEGIVSMMTPMGGMPMVFGHPRMLEMAKEAIKTMSKEAGRTMRIFKFKKSEVIFEVTNGH